MPVPTQEQVIEFCHENSIIDFLGVEIVPTDDGCARLELEVKPHHSNPYDILHGGVLTTMADTAMGAACLMRNKKVVTVSITLEFLHPVPINSRIITNARILNEGRNIITCECELIDADKKVYAKAHAIFYAIAKLIDD
ncbi:MAG: PaaI family thioesterase [Selenomonadaceae bacterium]|nr:PaaI family thioesterase [Selenomonadaceae bacterium]